MLKVLPVLLAVLVGIGMWYFSAWRARRELAARSTPLADPLLAAHAARFASVLELPRLEVRVYEVPMVNGLASPDGQVYLTRGFLDAYRRGEVSSAELASVIAHELAHVALGHTRRRMIDFTGQNAVRIVLALILARFVPVIGVWIADMLARVLAARLSRRDEYEADEWAAALMIRSGLGTGPQKSLLAKLDALVPRTGMPEWLLSHPKAASRIAAIEAHEARWFRAALPPDAA